MQIGRPARFDKATGERIDIRPQPEPGEAGERWNWDAPILISPHLHTRLYYGSQRLWRSDDRGDSWTAVSPDLTRNQNRYELSIAGRVWSVDSVWDHGAMSWYNSTTSISESPFVEGLIYVGTDDGIIQVTENGGQDWRRIDSLPGVAEFFYVNEVKASATDPDTVFAAVDNHKYGDYKPYLFKSTDRGRTWTSIAGDLPDRHLVWSVAQDHVKESLLFAGTEYGIFFTLNGGQNWIKFTGGVPTISFRDLEIQQRENDLVGATFGRGFYILDDYSPLRQMTEAVLEEGTLLFPVKKTLHYIEESPLGGGEKANLGAAYYTAPNPPFGAIFTYYLAESVKTGKETRRDREERIRDESGDIPFPGWDKLLEENREEQPLIVLTVTDSSGKIVRRIKGPAKKGFHRVAWDLRYPGFQPIRVEDGEPAEEWNRPSPGPLVLPGQYTVALSTLVNGEMTPLNQSQSFEVVALGGSTLPIQDPEEVLEFQMATRDLLRLAMGAQEKVDDAVTRIAHVKKALIDTPAASSELLEDARRIEVELADLKQLLDGNTIRRSLEEPDLPGLINRLQQIVQGHWRTTYGPTQTHRRNYEIASEAWNGFRSRLKTVVEQDLAQLEVAMEAAGAPYTPGRTIP
jgi:hypothetical protein